MEVTFPSSPTIPILPLVPIFCFLSVCFCVRRFPVAQTLYLIFLDCQGFSYTLIIFALTRRADSQSFSTSYTGTTKLNESRPISFRTWSFPSALHDMS